MKKKNKGLYIGLAVGGVVVGGIVLYSLLGKGGGDKYNINSKNPNNQIPANNPAQSSYTPPVATNLYPPPSGFTESDVKKVQAYLNKEKGERLDVDGKYGPATQAAVNKHWYQFADAIARANEGETASWGIWNF